MAERWNDFMLDTENFCNQFPKDPRESDDEFIRRQFAMMDTVRILRAHGQDGVLLWCLSAGMNFLSVLIQQKRG